MALPCLQRKLDDKMMEIAMLATFVAGVALLSRTARVGEQCAGFTLLSALLFAAASPA